MPTPKSIENNPIILYSKKTDEIIKTAQSRVFSIPNVDGLNFSFSGLKTNFKRCIEKGLQQNDKFIELD